MNRVFLITVLLFCTNLLAKTPSIPMSCGQFKGYKPLVERTYSDKDGIYLIDVTFISKRPTDEIIDKSIRDCISESLKSDNKKRILASAWYRAVKNAPEIDDELLHPYGSLKYIHYSPIKKSIEISDLTK